MRLHRAIEADWDGLSPRQLNFWQRLAVKTSGAVTPGNIVTLIGSLIVVGGLYDIYRGHFIAGIIIMLVGRGADVLDGVVAEATATKSPTGEALDATMDKILIALAIIVLLGKQLLPLIVGLVMLLQAGYNSALSLIAKYRPYVIKLHPSFSGKLSAFLEWLCVSLYVLAAHTASHGHAKNRAVIVLAGLSFAVFCILAGMSSIDYSRQFYKQSGHK